MFRALWRNFLFSLVGWIIFLVVAFVVLAAIGYLREKPIKIKPGSYLVVNLDAAIAESPNDAQRSLFSPKSITLREILKTIEYAGTLKEIKGIVLNGNFSESGLSWAAAEELRGALKEFKASGKDVQAYATGLDEKSYYVLSTANRLILNPQSDVEWNGIGADMPFVKGLLNKIGVEVEVVRAGKYKSMGEFLTRTKMSDEDREQMTRLVEVIWDKAKAGVAESRGHVLAQAGVLSRKIDAAVGQAGAEPPAGMGAQRPTNIPLLLGEDQPRQVGAEGVGDVLSQLDRIANEEGIISAPRALQLGMIDGVMFWNDFKRSLKVDKKHLVDFGKFQNNITKAEGDSDDTIALVYCDGELMRDENYTDLVDSLRKIKDDKHVKGVIFRINSPGGAVVPAAVIAAELDQIKGKVPVIVSMGGMAASGGYWIASSGKEVWADDLSITGSIGVVGLFPSVEKIASTLGVNFDRLATGPLSNIGSLSSPLDEKSRAVVVKLIAQSYADFLTKIANDRKLNLKDVETIAQGRVWMGSDAKGIKLVDNIGGLLKVEKRMRELVGITPVVETYPEESEMKLLKRLFKKDKGDLLGVNVGEKIQQIRASGPLWSIGPWGMQFN